MKLLLFNAEIYCITITWYHSKIITLTREHYYEPALTSIGPPQYWGSFLTKPYKLILKAKGSMRMTGRPFSTSWRDWYTSSVEHFTTHNKTRLCNFACTILIRATNLPTIRFDHHMQFFRFFQILINSCKFLQSLKSYFINSCKFTDSNWSL